MDSNFREHLGQNEYDYIGWIPCVSGHLDFARMRVGLHGVFMPEVKKSIAGPFSFIPIVSEKKDKCRTEVNYLASDELFENQRKILLQSWVDWRDEPTGDGQARVIVCAETNNSDSPDDRFLKGRLVIYPRRYKNEHRLYNSNIMDPIGEIAKLDSAVKCANKPDERQSTIDNLNQQWAAFKELLDRQNPLGDPLLHVYTLDFIIGVHGTVHLKYVPQDSDSVTDVDINTLCRQAFYYLKYSLHNHKHHGEKADALTTIVRWPNYTELQSSQVRTEINQKLNKVSLELINQLKRELTAIKREQQDKNELTYSVSPIGIIGYLRSLIKTCSSLNFLDNELANRENAWLDGMQLSFEAQHSKLDKISSTKRYILQIASQFVAIFVAIISLMTLAWINLNRQSIIQEGESQFDMLPFYFSWLTVKPDYLVLVFFAVYSVALSFILILYKAIKFVAAPKHLRVVFQENIIWSVIIGVSVIGVAVALLTYMLTNS